MFGESCDEDLIINVSEVDRYDQTKERKICLTDPCIGISRLAGKDWLVKVCSSLPTCLMPWLG